jgi:hypothetical protein
MCVSKKSETKAAKGMQYARHMSRIFLLLPLSPFPFSSFFWGLYGFVVEQKSFYSDVTSSPRALGKMKENRKIFFVVFIRLTMVMKFILRPKHSKPIIISLVNSV